MFCKANGLILISQVAEVVAIMIDPKSLATAREAVVEVDTGAVEVVVVIKAVEEEGRFFEK